MAGGMGVSSGIGAPQDCAQQASGPQRYANGVTAVPVPGAVPTTQVRTAPYDPTVGEMIQDHIREMQQGIKLLEMRYHEAKELGILHAKASAVRTVVGW